MLLNLVTILSAAIQTGLVSGTVADRHSDLPVSGANIVIVGGTRRAFSVLLENTLIAAPGPLKDETGALQWMQITTEEEPWRADICRISLP